MSAPDAGSLRHQKEKTSDSLKTRRWVGRPPLTRSLRRMKPPEIDRFKHGCAGQLAGSARATATAAPVPRRPGLHCITFTLAAKTPQFNPSIQVLSSFHRQNAKDRPSGCQSFRHEPRPGAGCPLSPPSTRPPLPRAELPAPVLEPESPPASRSLLSLLRIIAPHSRHIFRPRYRHCWGHCLLHRTVPPLLWPHSATTCWGLSTSCRILFSTPSAMTP